jgi:hypothetical protein
MTDFYDISGTNYPTDNVTARHADAYCLALYATGDGLPFIAHRETIATGHHLHWLSGLNERFLAE